MSTKKSPERINNIIWDVLIFANLFLIAIPIVALFGLRVVLPLSMNDVVFQVARYGGGITAMANIIFCLYYFAPKKFGVGGLLLCVSLVILSAMYLLVVGVSFIADNLASLAKF